MAILSTHSSSTKSKSLLPKSVLFLILLFMISLSFANAFKSYFDSTVTDLNSLGNDFVKTGSTVVGGGQAVVNNALDAFKPNSCGEEWGVGGFAALRTITLWLAPAVFIGTIVMVGVAIIYMLGQFLSSPQLIALAKDEGYQTGLTFIRVMFVSLALFSASTWYSLTARSSSTDPIYSDPNNLNMIDSAMAFSRLMVSNIATQYSMLLLYNMVLHTIYSSTLWFGVTWRAMYSFNLGPVLKPLLDVVGTSLQFLSLGLSEWLLHIVTLCIIKKWSWSFFIPAGMLLRSLPYTRQAGEALISLAFVLTLIYPFMFLFDYETHKILSNNIVDAKSAMSSFVNKSGIFSVFGSVVAVMMLMGGVFVPFFLGGALNLSLELVRGAVYYVVIISLLLPFLNIFVTLTAAKEFSKLFGFEVNYLSFLKII
ncbi:hypothetical protein HZC07_02220 [Candidatus Micrarchaeota archaeon]|nr:hypothetical protein [Candidatus Micrarchaeota archaeon]